MNKEIIKSLSNSNIPYGSAERLAYSVLNNSQYRKSKEAVNAIRAHAEAVIIEVVEAVSHLTKLSKRKTMTEDDVKTYFELINYSPEAIPAVIPYANLVRLANKVLSAEFRKTKEAMVLIRSLVESRIRNLVKKVVLNMDKLSNGKKTITDVEIVAAIE